MTARDPLMITGNLFARIAHYSQTAALTEGGGVGAAMIPPGSPQEPVTGSPIPTGLLENPLAETAIWAAGIFLLSWLADVVAKRILLKLITRLVRRTRFKWDDAFQERRIFHHLAHIAPAAVVYFGAGLVPSVPVSVNQMVQRVALALMVVIVAASASATLSAINDLYTTRPDAKSRPIKGYLQIVSIVLYIAAAILVVSLLLDRSPAVFLGGLAGLTAVVLLVFRDTILSLVASIQLTQNDMIAVGDWIEMPRFGADGDVVDIALHTVKVQNWDKTITTIPTHKLIEDSFKNWRGMSQAGGRRVKRSVSLDLGTVRFLTEEEIERFGRFELLRDYIRRKRDELDAYNAGRLQRMALDPGEEARGEPIIANSRRLTNVGTFRAYVVNYLRQHPLVHPEMTLLVRQLQSGPTGLPIEIYVFSRDTNWINYEGFQSDIFDHLMAMVPEFGLRVFQSPSGEDLRAMGRVLGHGDS